MALVDFNWYCNFGNGTSTGYYAVTLRPQNAAVAAGVLRRQFTAPAVGSERVFVCIVAGTTANVADATWVLTRGAKTTDGTVTWMECTGQAALNGDLTNTATWAQVKAATPAVLGQIIKRSNNASYQICTTAGAMSASEPAFSDTAGVTTTDTTAVWTSLGVVGNFTGGQAPHARLANACANTWFAAGNTLYVGDNHAESQATAITLNPAGAGVTSSVGKILCHNRSGSYPPAASDLTTGATVSTTAAVAITFNPNAAAWYFYGVTFKAGVGVSTVGASISFAPLNSIYSFEQCSFQIASTFSSSTMVLNGTAAGVVIWNNCKVSFGAVGQYIDVGATNFVWQNTGQILESGSSIPTGLFGQSANARMANIQLEALDLSQLTSALDRASAIFEMGNWLIKDCKLNASMTIPTPLAYGQTVQFVRSDSSATAYKSARYVYEGTETTETSITRVGGAVDPTGQAQSRKIVTTANVQWLRPFRAEPYAVWNDRTATNVTVTVCGAINAGALPMNDDIWMEVEYLSDVTVPLGKIVNTTKASLLASNAVVASDGSNWNGASFPRFDESTASSNVVISNNGLTATHTNTTSQTGARSAVVDLKTTGKFYFEITIGSVVSGADAAGILEAAGTYANMISTGTNCTVIYATSGNIWSNGVNTTKTLGALAAGDVIGVAVDLTAHLGWLRKNNGNWNNDGTANPATGVGGVTIAAGSYGPAVAFATFTGSSWTMNFSATAFANAAPSGFSNWSAVWTLFKLTTTLSSPQPQLAGYIHARIRAAKPSATYYIDPQVVLS